MKIEHIECQVICDGQVLTEYQEKDDGQRAKSCHITSEAGKHFAVRTQSNPHEFDVACHLWIDGNCIHRTTIRKSREFEIRGIPVDTSTIKPFLFSSIVLTDDDDALQEGSINAKDLGTICCKFYRVKDFRETGSYYSSSFDIDTRPVHERAKKAGGHRVILGKAEPSNPKPGLHVTFMDPVESPYYTFTWRYRSKGLSPRNLLLPTDTDRNATDLLQAQGIVPLDPPPPPAKRPGSSTPAGNSSKRPRTERSPPQQGSSSRVKLEDTPTARDIREWPFCPRTPRSSLSLPQGTQGTRAFGYSLSR
ncbi:hypothetical protein BC629DRAFT_1731549 [Irpex lacteus]|nr:hypothetical protein BC629DRAFT_1731549 [Irpex lacteus]